MSHGGHEKKFFGGRPLTIALLVIFIIAACVIFIPNVVHASSDEEIVIGALLPMSGPISEMGNEFKNGIDLAVEDLQNSGRKVTVKYVDTECDEAKTIDRYFSLVHDGVKVILGPVNTDEAKAIAPYVEMYKTPAITFATGIELDEYANYLFRFAPSDKYLITCIINGIERSGTHSLAVIWKNDQYGSDFAKHLIEAVEEDVPEVTVYNIPLTSVTSAVNQLAKERPGCIFVIPENAKQLSDLRSAAYEKGIGRYSNWFSADTGFGQEVIENIDCLDTYIPTQRKADNDAAFNKRYAEKYGMDPNGFAPYGYDALNMAFDVLTSVGNDGPKAAAAMKKYRILGKTGPVNFDHELNRFPLMETMGAGFNEWYTVEKQEYLMANDDATMHEYYNLVQDLKTAYHAGDINTFDMLYTLWIDDDFTSYLKYKAEHSA